MGLPITASVAMNAAASANNIATSQTPSGAGDLTLTAGALAGTVPGTVGVPATARKVLFTPAGAEGANGTVWTVYGTNAAGFPISENVAGADNPATATTVQDFLTVTQISVNKAQANAVTVGTSGLASTMWQIVNTNADPCQFGIGVVVTGTISFTVEYTFDNPNAMPTGTFPTAFAFSDLTSKVANTAAALNMPVRAIRLSQNSLTYPATATMTIIPAGLASP